MDNESIKRKAKNTLGLNRDYQIWEVVEALLEDDKEKLEKMRKRLQLLKSHHSWFCEELDSGDEARIKKAKAEFRRPNNG
jgi:hypothetical protein